MSKLDDLVRMYMRMLPDRTEEEIRAQVMRNAGIGLNPTLSSSVLDMDPPSRIISGLRDLHDSIKEL